MNTQGRFEMDTPMTDGVFGITIDSINQFGAGATTTKTRTAKGNYALITTAAAASAVYASSFEGLLFRIGMLPFLQQQFGTAAGVAGPTSVANTSSPDAQVGAPPQTGTSLLTPATGFIPKGIKITDITLKYSITGQALTAHTIGLSKTVFANNAALVITDILANANNGLATATQANPYVTKVPLVTPVFQVSDLADLWLEIDITQQAASVYSLFGASVHVAFNYN